MDQKNALDTGRVTIRHAVSGDLDAVLRLVRELAHYERAPEAVTATLADYEQAFSDGVFRALVAVYDGEVIGTAIYFQAFSTWKGRMIYLDDFVVREACRRLGVGKLLFEEFLQQARSAGAILCKWQVLDWNEAAINFYRKYDTIFEHEWVDVKMFLR